MPRPCTLVRILADFELTVGDSPRIQIEQKSEEKHCVVPTGMIRNLGIMQVRDSVMDSKPAAYAENVDSHEKRVEVEHLAMAIGM